MVIRLYRGGQYPAGAKIHPVSNLLSFYCTTSPIKTEINNMGTGGRFVLIKVFCYKVALGDDGEWIQENEIRGSASPPQSMAGSASPPHSRSYLAPHSLSAPVSNNVP